MADLPGQPPDDVQNAAEAGAQSRTRWVQQEFESALRPDAVSLDRGAPFPLGATVGSNGVNFALFAGHASRVDLCLYDRGGQHEILRLPMPAHTDGVWHGFLPGARAGLLYGYRVFAPPLTVLGDRFNPAKLLLDPYARDIAGDFSWHPSQFDVQPAEGPALPVRSELDSGRWVPKARVVEDHFDWCDDRPPQTPLDESILYEVHVRGFTQTHPGVPAALRGTYAGLASEAALAHFRELGVTAVNLLPVHFAVDEERLVRLGLRNYWAYNTLGFFAPNPRYGLAHSGMSIRDQFRAMVRALHGAGIEVILDVVYNHTAESDALGPTLSFRGIDNRAYYRLTPDQSGRYENFTGCGNTLRLSHPRVLQMVMDSLRYWVEEMHVDGFRFDLATVLAREDHGFDPGSGFLDAIRQDPCLARIKLIAEPWDIGPGGYQLGRFPSGWSEWNDRFRDSLRGFWLQNNVPRGELARRWCASSDVFAHHGRAPQASLHFVTAHDGFTLHDLVSYADKHNLANGEANRDGHHDNRSINCGVEGPTKDLAVLALRGRLKRAILASLLLSQGVPMLLGGDELGRTQHGNNNAYCQDGELNWFDWPRADRTLAAYVAHLIRLRKAYPVLRNRTWFTGQVRADGQPDLRWLAPAGGDLSAADWDDATARSLGLLLAAQQGEGALLLLINGAREDSHFTLPAARWEILLDSSSADGVSGVSLTAGHPVLVVPAHAVMLLCEPPTPQVPGPLSH